MLTVVAAAYDGTLHGWKGEDPTDLSLAFAFRAHESCIRTLDVSGHMACTAASDESIQVYDVNKKKVLDRMSGVHEDEVTALALTRSKNGEMFLLSGDRTGRLYVWQLKDRRVIHELKGHKQSSEVTSIAVHPTGRVALSTARDNSLRMWDLVNAKAAPRTKLADFSQLSCACWSPNDGSRYGVVGDDKTVLIFDAIAGSEKPIGTLVHPRRVNALRFVQDVILASACDDGTIRIIGADGGLIRQFKAETRCRARDVVSLTRTLGVDADGEEVEEVIVGGAFSDGSLRLWDLDSEEDEPITTLSLGTSAHVTCMGMSWSGNVTTQKRHADEKQDKEDDLRPAEEDDESSEEELEPKPQKPKSKKRKV